MELDRNAFFRQAALRICGSLDIDKALLSFMDYIRLFIPVSVVTLSMFDPSTGILSNLANVDQAGKKKTLPPLPLSRSAIQELESALKAGAASLSYWNGQSELVKILRPDFDLSNRSVLAVDLALEGKRLGFLALYADGNTGFTQEHMELVSLLREPFSIAMSNALRYEELVKLKEIVDAENRELSRELRRYSSSEIVGADFGLKDVMEMVRQVAPLSSPVILLGETGTGKELIANAIHYTSSRRSGPLIKINCGAIPDSLVDSELFGHERGAFTGAITQKKGRFERADTGTIFLDEVGELPSQVQLRLLRVLQEKEIERVGGTRPIPVDVRVIAATHRDMAELVRTGVFREDLWFRLNVFPITLPPLRQRREDIPALVHHFLEKKSKDLKIYPPPTVSIEEVERLKAYHWPGNIRELENLIERELIHTRGKRRGERLTFEPLEVLENSKASSLEPEREDNLLTLDEAMSRQIRQALQRCNGKVSGPGGAARLLGINPNTLRSRMRKLGISLKISC
ncbi:sigma-54-dependent Fis family transcriptional regulator [Desulforhabdus amnigena]|uniref:ATPase AAA n=1 Tax=Desulforhabdus amnigena TaxID=40218 RepID=A0A9W6CWA9_9BACT|nr:sigma-54-dependent Fis family transcriptional regulator [Desulforhabdus amnigena]NLJ27664.1 sigma-54-dependent Fis family transcriptional regulator [Deltaproteobacteria bacterium]GLI33046.1 ATPase AAA [Desulforhabdus amnigena]